MKKLFIFVFVFVAMIAFSQNYKSTINNSNQVSTLSDNDRMAIKTLFLSCMDSIVETTKDEEAAKIARFVRENNVMAVPHPEGVRYIEGAGNKKNWFIIIPFCQQDRQLSNLWSDMVAKSSSFAAMFLHKQRALLIKSTPEMSNTWKGIAMIHEGLHALFFISNPYTSQTDDEYAAEELKAHNIQNRIMLKLGGEKYQELLDQEKNRLKKKIADNNIRLGVDIFNRDKNYPELEKLFEKSKSEFEINWRGTSFWMHAIFELIDDQFKEDASEIKISFLKKLYKSGGIR